MLSYNEAESWGGKVSPSPDFPPHSDALSLIPTKISYQKGTVLHIRSQPPRQRALVAFSKAAVAGHALIMFSNSLTFTHTYAPICSRQRHIVDCSGASFHALRSSQYPLGSRRYPERRMQSTPFFFTMIANDCSSEPWDLIWDQINGSSHSK